MFPSIHDNIEPLEMGGVLARDGFLFQDHVAAKWCLEMLLCPDLSEVRCESHDDVTLIWTFAERVLVEFVQVKGAELNQLWSVAKICEKSQSAVSAVPTVAPSAQNASLIEKLVANDRFREESRFRIVTRRSVNSELTLLTMPFNSPLRQPTAPQFQSFCAELAKRNPGLRSPKGNGIEYLVSNCAWDVEHDIDDLKSKNFGKLHRVAESAAFALAESQIDALYQKLLLKVQEAACADWRNGPGIKAITRTDFKDWFDCAVLEVLSAIPAPGAEVVRLKMESAGLPPDYIVGALDNLRVYQAERLSPRYYESAARDLMDSEVMAELQNLLVRFDAGELGDSSVTYLKECYARLKALQTELNIEPKPPLSHLYGCMYFITGRCGHRFRRYDREVFSTTW